MKKKVDVARHFLVPKHSKLSEREKQEILKRYNISLGELPMILKSDAAIAGLGVKPGDVIKIKRISPTAGESIFYRVVVGD
jgi:DNA-directed RNA polymerase subunit H